MRVKVPLYRASCLLPVFLGLCILIGGCAATVTTFQSDGKTPASQISVPLGMEWSETEKKLSGDPVAIEAGVKLGTKALEVGGEAFANKMADNLAKQAQMKE